MGFPKWFFHETEAAIIVQDEQELEALGLGWEETPAAFDQKDHEASDESETLQDEISEDEQADKKIILKKKTSR